MNYLCQAEICVRHSFVLGLEEGGCDKKGYWAGALGPARNPPSRTSDWPVMKEARSEHIQRTASATSVGLPKRPMGWRPRANLFISGAPKIRSPMGVSMTAGQTALMRIPLVAFSSAALLVRPMTPCLVAQYVAAPAEPIHPATDDMLTMAPRERRRTARPSTASSA